MDAQIKYHTDRAADFAADGYAAHAAAHEHAAAALSVIRDLGWTLDIVSESERSCSLYIYVSTPAGDFCAARISDHEATRSCNTDFAAMIHTWRPIEWAARELSRIRARCCECEAIRPVSQKVCDCGDRFASVEFVVAD